MRGYEDNERPATSGRLRRFIRRWEWAIWIGGLALVLMVRWPMIKGAYYRAADVAAPRPAIAWRTDLEAALAEARRTNKHVLVDISADWCPPCIVMKHDVWPDPRVERAVAAAYVPLLVDADRDTTVTEAYGIRGIPTILILDPDGGLVRQAAYLPVAGMLRFLEGA